MYGTYFFLQKLYFYLFSTSFSTFFIFMFYIFTFYGNTWSDAMLDLLTLYT